MFNPQFSYQKLDDHSVIVHAKGGLFGGGSMIIPLPKEQFKECWNRRAAGELIQSAFPMLNSTQREFLISGMTENKQKKIFGSDDQ